MGSENKSHIQASITMDRKVEIKSQIKLPYTLFCFALIASYLITERIASAEIITTDDGPEVTIATGTLKGRWQLSRNTRQIKERNFSSFEGIPYAKPPRRFQSPEPANSWTGIRNATYTRTICPQLEGINLEFHDQTEDCLFLNVYVPQTNPVKTLPTMVWIHGGAFMEGAGSFYGPKYMMEKDVILVTLNYRLGALGFLNTGDRLIEGNLGLKDMILALKWVQVNIGAFSGDPENVTIFGESAGGVAVHTLMISPAAKGLFQKVISQSGTALCPWSLIQNPKEVAINLAKELKCSTTNSTTMVQCFNTKSIREILEAQQKLPAKWSLGLTVDTNATDFSVLPDTPINLVINPHPSSSAGVPFIIGFNQQEGLLDAAEIVTRPKMLQDLNTKWNEVAPQILGYVPKESPKPKNLNRITKKIKNFYFKGTPEITLKNLDNITNLYTDYYFLKDTKRTAVLHAKYNQHVYPYELTYKGNFSLVIPYGLKPQEPTHSDDLQYLFPSLLGTKQNWPNLAPGSYDEEFSVNLISLWTSFAYNGGKLKFLSQNWSPLSLQTNTATTNPLSTVTSWYNLRSYNEAENENIPETSDVTKRLQFWDAISIADKADTADDGSLPRFLRWTNLSPVVILTRFLQS